MVLDDLLNSAGASKEISKLFTLQGHNKNLTGIFIVQNLFYHYQEMRTFSLNDHYLVLYRNPTD